MAIWLDIICAMHPISVDYTQRKNSKNLVLVEIGGNLQPNGSEANMKGGEACEGRISRISRA